MKTFWLQVCCCGFSLPFWPLLHTPLRLKSWHLPFTNSMAHPSGVFSAFGWCPCSKRLLGTSKQNARNQMPRSNPVCLNLFAVTIRFQPKTSKNHVSFRYCTYAYIYKQYINAQNKSIYRKPIPLLNPFFFEWNMLLTFVFFWVLSFPLHKVIYI